MTTRPADPMPEPTTDRGVDASAELAHYADKYRDTPIGEQFDLLLIYAKLTAANTGDTSLTTSEIQWLYKSVRDALATERPAADTVTNQRSAVERSLQLVRSDEIAEAMAGDITYTQHAHDLTVQRITQQLFAALESTGYTLELSIDRADPYPDHARMDAYAQGYNDASRDAALSAASEPEPGDG